MASRPLDSLLFDFSRATKVIAVLDVVESVRLMEHDEQGFIQRWHDFVDQATARVLPAHGGRMHKSLGDGLMLEFDDARQCIQACFQLQDLCRQGNVAQPQAMHIHLRTGAHLAEFVADAYDIYGRDVNLTARVATLAGPGEIVVTADLRDRLTAGLDAAIEDLGDCHLKHVQEPVRAYRVGPAGHAPVVERNIPAAALRPTIAVIPFSVRSDEPGHAMLGEALADEVIAGLSRTPELTVISRLSTTAFSGRQHATPEIRTLLGAHYVLSGTCRSAGSNVALFVELVETASGSVVWADTLKGSVQDIFSLNDDLVVRLVAGAGRSIISRELARAMSQPLPTLESHTLLLGAITLMHRTQASQFDRARLMLEHLAERSRRHPLPHAWLAKWHVLRASQGWSSDAAAEAQQAHAHTQRALDSDPSCSLALAIDGLVRTNLQGDFEGAEQCYEQALAVNPNDSLAWLLKGMFHAWKGEGPQAREHVTRANVLSPLDPMRYFYESLTVSAYVCDGRYDEAIEIAKASLRHNATHASTYRSLLLAQSLSGRSAEAKATLAKLQNIEPDFTVRKFTDRYPGRHVAPEFARFLGNALAEAGVPLA